VSDRLDITIVERIEMIKEVKILSKIINRGIQFEF